MSAFHGSYKLCTVYIRCLQGSFLAKLPLTHDLLIQECPRRLTIHSTALSIISNFGHSVTASHLHVYPSVEGPKIILRSHLNESTFFRLAVLPYGALQIYPSMPVIDPAFSPPEASYSKHLPSNSQSPTSTEFRGQVYPANPSLKFLMGTSFP